VAGDGRPGDAVLVNAVIGVKRLGDFVDEAILEGREALGLGGYFAGGGTWCRLCCGTLWCRDWRLALPAAVLLALFLAAVFGVGG